MRKLPKLCLSILMLAGSLTFGFASSSEALPYNPCYQFDNPSIGCYRTWSPQELCCKGTNRNGCYDLCY